MSVRISRRSAMKAAGAAAFPTSLNFNLEAASARQWPLVEGPDTPKICLAPGDGGGPLPAEVQTSIQGGRGGPAPAPAERGGGNAQYGGTLAPRAEAAQPAAGVGRGVGGNQTAAYQRIQQLGVNHLLGVGIGGNPWTVEAVRRTVEAAKAAGMVAYNSMINVPASVIYNRETRAKDMEPFLASIEAAGKGGLAVVEYNWYAHRATEGYYERVGRANAGYTEFDYDLELLVNESGGVVQGIQRDEDGKITPETVAANPNARRVKLRDLPPLANEGAHNLNEMWANITYFLKAAIPVAEKYDVRLALHPNDPPAPVSRGSQQIMGTVEGWKRLISIVNSPANGITFDCGVATEMGSNAVEAAEYFASRKRINHMHYRNVRVVKPYERYTELFIDAGQCDMFGVMKAIVKNKYTGTIYPEHPRALDYDRDRGRIGGYPGGGGYAGIAFSVAYTRAMIQAAMMSV